MKTIKVKIKDGKTEIKAEGYPGHTCKDATKAFEEALGQVVEDVETHEMEAEVEQEHVSEGGM